MAARTVKVKFDGDSTGLKSATQGASTTLERFNKSTDETKRGMDRVGESSEALADHSSLATGALGALASGFELVGLDGYAENLQKASMATDFLSGVGDSLTLVTSKLGVATKLQTVATWAQTGAQRALNFAMSANPIGLVIAAVAGLVAVLVIAYKKSDTFRRIVNGAFSAVTNAARAAFGWLKKNWPLVLAILTGPVGLAVLFITRKWDAIIDGLRGAKNRIGGIASGMWDGIKDAFRSALNWIIGKWNGLEFRIPSIDTHIPGVGKVGGFSLGTPNIGYLASGGFGLPGRTYLTGENGPELIRFGPGGGFVTPNNQLTGAGVGTSELRDLAGRLLDLLATLMQDEISSSNRGLKRRALAGTGATR